MKFNFRILFLPLFLCFLIYSVSAEKLKINYIGNERSNSLASEDSTNWHNNSSCEKCNSVNVKDHVEKLNQCVESEKVMGNGNNNFCNVMDTLQFLKYGWEPFNESKSLNKSVVPASNFKIDIRKNSNVEEGIEAGLSASYVGIIDGELFQAGGANFPIDPLGPASKKKFYKGIYRLIQKNDYQWIPEKIGELPEAVAYGSAVSVPDGIVMIGGNNENSSLNKVFLLQNINDGIEISSLPDLPFTIDNAYATYADNIIYIAGGNVNGQPSNSLFSLDLNKLSEGWKKISEFPGNPRVQPVIAVGEDSDGNLNLYLWGGFAPKGNGREATLNTDGYRYDVKNNKWISLNPPVGLNNEEISLGGGVATTLPDGRIVATGGVNKDIFLEALRNQAPDYLSHPMEWYRFNDNILIFDPKTEKWEVYYTDKNAARAGAGMIADENNDIYIIGGELKPRIRSAEIEVIKVN